MEHRNVKKRAMASEACVKETNKNVPPFTGRIWFKIRASSENHSALEVLKL